MLALQRHHEQRWRDVADVLEELTTTWYFGAAMIVLWLLSRVLQNNVLLALAGLVIWPDPPWSRCWRKTKATSPYVETSHTPLSRLWPLSPTAATNFPDNLQTRILQVNLFRDVRKMADRVYPRQILQPDRHVFDR